MTGDATAVGIMAWTKTWAEIMADTSREDAG